MHAREHGEGQRQAERAELRGRRFEHRRRHVPEAGRSNSVEYGQEDVRAEARARPRQRVEREDEGRREQRQARQIHQHLGGKGRRRRQTAAAEGRALPEEHGPVPGQRRHGRERRRHAQCDRHHEVDEPQVPERKVRVEEAEEAAGDDLRRHVAGQRAGGPPLLARRAQELVPELAQEARRLALRQGAGARRRRGAVRAAAAGPLRG
mmetsp:Transcript_8219/g.24629  ORF Transcript_8219/g.24629 Transcript_8219/m.24629 type:complete len:207 (-) Transcript_8219:1217-1837(-)